MIASSIQLNNLHVNQTETIKVNHVPEVQWDAIWWQPQWKKVYRLFDRAYRQEVNGSDTETIVMMVASIMQWLHLRSMSLINKYYTRTLIYQP